MMVYKLTPSRSKAHSNVITRFKCDSTHSSLLVTWQITTMKDVRASPSVQVEVNMPPWVMGPLPTLSMS